MDDDDTHDMTALARLVAEGEVTPDELLDAALNRLHATNPHLNALAGLFEDAARARIGNGLPDGPFTGVPFLLKDLGCEATDLPTGDGSRLTGPTRWPVDSTIYRRLLATGLVPFARMTTPENGIGVATEAALYGGPTRNPWNPDHTPGGSSGGSAAAVAAGVVPGAHGSDGGGSVRIPASCCGLFGFKPTRARLPDGPYAGEGWAGMAIDGFLTRSVRDTATLLDCCAGDDGGAPYTAPAMPISYTKALDTAPGRLRIAYCDTSFADAPLHPQVREALEDTGRLLESMGHDLIPATPDADHRAMIESWVDIVACGTALSVTTTLNATNGTLDTANIERVTRTAIDHAATISGARYLKAIGTIHAYGRRMDALFENFDVLLTPTLAEPPARIGRFNHDAEYLDFRLGQGRCFDYSPFTAAFNASGQPAMSVPLAWSPDSLPIGMHLAARFGDDARLMSLAADLERARPWFSRRPAALPVR